MFNAIALTHDGLRADVRWLLLYSRLSGQAVTLSRLWFVGRWPEPC